MQRPFGIPYRGKEVLTVTRDRSKFADQIKRLAKEGHKMLHPRLHAFGRDSPLRGQQVKLPPTRLAKFPWAHKEEECELQGDADDLAAGVSVDGAQ
jgi:hypothetical protein